MSAVCDYTPRKIKINGIQRVIIDIASIIYFWEVVISFQIIYKTLNIKPLKYPQNTSNVI